MVDSFRTGRAIGIARGTPVDGRSTHAPADRDTAAASFDLRFVRISHFVRINQKDCHRPNSGSQDDDPASDPTQYLAITLPSDESLKPIHDRLHTI